MLFIFGHAVADTRDIPSVTGNFCCLVWGGNFLAIVDEFSHRAGLGLYFNVICVECVCLRVFDAKENWFVQRAEVLLGLDTGTVIMPNNPGKNAQAISVILTRLSF